MRRRGGRGHSFVFSVLAFVFSVLGITVVLVACTGTVPAGSSCDSSGQCQSGLACLYPLGSGCGALGQCAIETSDCAGSSANLVLCGCAGDKLDLSCIPSSAALPQRTATGTACMTDGGFDTSGAALDARAPERDSGEQ